MTSEDEPAPDHPRTRWRTDPETRERLQRQRELDQEQRRRTLAAIEHYDRCRQRRELA
jgi:hypothetical protein